MRATSLLEHLGHDVQPLRLDIDRTATIDAFLTLVASSIAASIDDVAYLKGQRAPAADEYELTTWMLRLVGRKLTGQQAAAAFDPSARGRPVRRRDDEQPQARRHHDPDPGRTAARAPRVGPDDSRATRARSPAGRAGASGAARRVPSDGRHGARGTARAAQPWFDRRPPSPVFQARWRWPLAIECDGSRPQRGISRWRG